ncbi:autophagy-related protein 18g isoform X2 [Euphorbia lathyris]|uniref:autophagy-related protein 18g isoform X2 n=1 Tax=Euphorbia lathyris TaxID=212925 RepID=UPI003313F5F3
MFIGEQVTWAGFDRLELGPSVIKHVLLLGYENGFQVLDVENASNFSELVSKRDGPVSFLQMQPFPEKSDGHEGFKSSHPLLVVVAGDTSGSKEVQNHSNLGALGRDVNIESHSGNYVSSPTSVKFYSLRSQCYVHVLRFRSAVRMVRCSPRFVAVGLATQIYCIDALTLESKFSVLTYPVPQLAGQGTIGVNVGYGPMAVSPRWLAYASNNPLVSSNTRLSPQNLTPSPGVSPSTSPGGSSLVARYAMESRKQLAAGIINLGDMGYKTLSKYCQELLPDGSNSPVSSSSGWKVSRLAGSDMDNAGMVVVKDFVSREVISQFKAHTSPISALCFDPSGTLLVTASVYGNNINIFRIMPSCSRSGSGVQTCDWSSSHVHLYKLHRGITSAMIQDIGFSHYSQWIAVVSSKGTCHIFVLSPFGGDCGFQSLNSTGEEPSLYPVLSLPWWSTSSCTMNKHSSPPPPPVSLSVVSRIKYSSFGWLNTVSSATGSTAGKVFVPSGAVAAIFHNSISQTVQHVNSRVNSLEHLLVYTPSGHVVQHELLPSMGLELGESGSRSQRASFVHIQEDDLKVKVEPVQWWDVCRRSDWSEREECIFGTTVGKNSLETMTKACSADILTMDFLDINGNINEKQSIKTHCSKSHERSHWYLSNAEVQNSSIRFPIWQKSKICFCVMDSTRVKNYGDGEFEIENVPVNEVELKRKELLPVFDHFHGIKSGWNDRGLTVSRYSPISDPHQAEGKVMQETVICHSKPASLSSTESSECDSSRRTEHLLDLDQISCEKLYMPIGQSLNGYYQDSRGGAIFENGSVIQDSTKIVSVAPEYPKSICAHVDNCIENVLPPSANYLPPAAGETPTLSSTVPLLATDSYAPHVDILAEEPTLVTPECPVNFEEGHCKANLDESPRSTEVVTDDVDSIDSHGEKEKPEEDGENDEFLGGMFAFAEEG